MKESVTTPRTDFTHTPVAETNDLIISALTTASLSLFLANKAASGRITQGAARQLLAEVYLRTNQANLAEQQCQAILTSNQYSLIRARYGVRAGSPGNYHSNMFLATVKDLPLMRLGETYLLLIGGSWSGSRVSVPVSFLRSPTPYAA